MLLKKSTHPEILVLTLDYDGCTYTIYGRDKLKKWLLDYLETHPTITKVFYFIGSLRQSFDMDLSNAVVCKSKDQLRSCRILGGSFLKELKADLGNTISFLPLLTYDIYHQLPIGTTFDALPENNYCAVIQEFNKTKSYTVKRNNTHNRPVTLFSTNDNPIDRSHLNKHDMAYGQMHYIANRLGSKQNFIYVLLDDKKDILESWATFFSKHSMIIPQTCLLGGIHFAPGFDDEALPPDSYMMPWIQGQGQINPYFAADMRYIKKKCLTMHVNDSTKYCELFSSELTQLPTLKSKFLMHMANIPFISVFLTPEIDCRIIFLQMAVFFVSMGIFTEVIPPHKKLLAMGFFAATAMNVFFAKSKEQESFWLNPISAHQLNAL